MRWVAGAIVHTVAVGDDVNCSSTNDLIHITRNGGRCFSIPEPDNLLISNLTEGILGTTLESVELRVDTGNYTAISNISEALPQDGATSVDFDTLALGLAEGSHEICVRAKGTDSLNGSAYIEDCHEVFVVSAAPQDGLPGWKIFLLVVTVFFLIFVFSCVAKIAFCRSNKEADQPNLEAPSSGEGGEGPSIV